MSATRTAVAIVITIVSKAQSLRVFRNILGSRLLMIGCVPGYPHRTLEVPRVHFERLARLMKLARWVTVSTSDLKGL